MCCVPTRWNLFDLYLVVVTFPSGKIGPWLNGSSKDILTVEPLPLSYTLSPGFPIRGAYP